MATVIIRGLDETLANRLKQEAGNRGMSLNRYVCQVLAQSAHRVEDAGALRTGPRNDLRKFAGRWTKRQARDFDRAVQPFAEIDPDLWK